MFCLRFETKVPFVADTIRVQIYTNSIKKMTVLMTNVKKITIINEI